MNKPIPSGRESLVIPTMHILVSQYGDPILFVGDKATNTVHIAGAERSFGIKWATGTFSAQDARDLWDRIMSSGGRVADGSIASKFASIVEDANASMREALLQAQEDLKDFQSRLSIVKGQVEDAQARHEEERTYWVKEMDLRVAEAIQALMKEPSQVVDDFNLGGRND